MREPFLVDTLLIVLIVCNGIFLEKEEKRWKERKEEEGNNIQSFVLHTISCMQGHI